MTVFATLSVKALLEYFHFFIFTTPYPPPTRLFQPPINNIWTKFQPFLLFPSPQLLGAGVRCG